MKSVILTVLSCFSVGQVCCQDMSAIVSATAFGAATPVLVGGAAAGISWFAGSYIGRSKEAAALGALGSIALFEYCFGGRNENEAVESYRRTLDILQPTGTEADRAQRARTAWNGEKCAKISIAGVALYILVGAIFK